MFTDISVHAEFSHCRQNSNWYYGLQAMYSSMAIKSGGSVHILSWTLTSRKWGGQDSTPAGSAPLIEL